MKSMKSILIVVLLLVMSMNDAYCWDFVRQNEKVVFDENNHLVFEDVGRISKTANGQEYTGFGKYVRLHVVRNGEKFKIDMVDNKYALDDPRYQIISPRLIEIKYMDKDNVWFKSQSHVGQGCTLYNLAEKSVVEKYGGVQIELSPDASKVAVLTDLARNSTGWKRENAVFVNSTMVFPFIEAGFTKWSLTNPDVEHRIEKTSGRSVADILNEKDHVANGSGHPIPDLSWKNNDSLVFHVKNRVRDTTATCLLVTGLQGREPLISTIRTTSVGIDPIKKDAGEK